MAFRADEAAQSGYESAKSYLIPRTLAQAEREKSERVLRDIIEECGPVVDAYPTWHPLVSSHDGRDPQTYPNKSCGYRGLDHTVYFAHGFITCPYGPTEEIFESIANLPPHPCSTISAEQLDVQFYSSNAVPILVRCEWTKPLSVGNLIPKSIAVPLMIEQELPCWRWSEIGETWETMRPYLLGKPHGSRSSLFVDQETAISMKDIYSALIKTGMFGPVKYR